MDGWLKQSTAITLRIGPFLDPADGNTQKTALTIAQADVVLSKAGGAFAQKNDATSCTHDTRGYYSCPLNATDTNTLGMLKLAVHVSGALAVWHTFMVVNAQVWDSLFGTQKLQVNVVEQANIDFGALQKASLNAATPASVQGNVGGNVLGSVASVVADVGITQAGADKVWTSATRTLTAFAQSFSDQTWTSTTRTLTAFAQTFSDQVWNSTTRTLTSFGTLVADIWGYSTRTLTSFGTLIADIFNYAVEGSLTFVQSIRIKLSALARKSAGGGTATLTFRDGADSKNRISATVDSNGNRTSVTLDGT